MKSIEEIGQWVVDNRYPNSELNNISDFELFHVITGAIKSYSEQYALNCLEKASDNTRIEKGFTSDGVSWYYRIDKHSIASKDNLI